MSTTGEKEVSKEEEDLLERSKRRSKENEGKGEDASKATEEKTERRSYSDSVLGYGRRRNIRGEELDDGEVSDDDLIDESSDGTWIGWGLTREQKKEAGRP